MEITEIITYNQSDWRHSVDEWVWNRVPPDVVNAPSFKNRLDKHWSNQDAMYNWRAELSGSECGRFSWSWFEIFTHLR